MKPAKLRTKFTGFYGGVTLLLLAALSLLFYRLLGYQLNKDLNDDLNLRAAALRGYFRLENGQPVLNYDIQDPEEAYFINRAARFFQIWDLRNSKLLLQSPELHATGIEFLRAELKDLGQSSPFSEMETDHVHLRFHNTRIRFNNGSEYLLQVGASLETMETALGKFLEVILWLVPVCALMAGVAGWFLAGRVLQPIEELGRAAGEIGIARLDRRLPVRGSGDELDRLALTFNHVFEKLEQAVSEMKDFTAGISHELRTPLTALRGEAEVALSENRPPEEYRQVLESQLEEFEKLGKMINQMLTLARAEAGELKLAAAPLDLSVLAAALVEQMRPLADWKSTSLHLQISPPVWVKGDGGWLEHAFLNLMDNAIKFTPTGGTVEVIVRQDKNLAVFEVRDTGRGIPEEALPHLFQRFYRVDSSRSGDQAGTGLGLSLVQWIIAQHDGTISVMSRLGTGSTFRVQLPLYTSAA